jgi:hypothetical protein
LDKFRQSSLVVLRHRLACPLRLAGHTGEATDPALAGPLPRPPCALSGGEVLPPR